MLKKARPTRIAVVLSLILLIAVSATWAVQTYSSSVIVKKQKGFALFKIIGWEVFGEVRRNALDAYMEEQGVNNVEITVDVTEELVERDDGSSFYRLDFTFGPSGCHFDPPLELNIDGQYVADGAEIWLYDENGELLEGHQSFQYDDQMTFYIPHFSSYSYDHY